MKIKGKIKDIKINTTEYGENKNRRRIMKNLKPLILLLGLSLFLTSCATMPDHFIKIPRTPDNLQAYRECQRTWATAVGYDGEGFNDLKAQCLKTLSGLTEEVVEDNGEKYDEIKKKYDEQCTLIEGFYLGGVSYYYYFCETN